MRLRLANPKIDPWMIALPVGGVALVAASAWAVSRMLGDPSIPSGYPPPRTFKGVPFAEGGWRPIWPIISEHDDLGLVSYEDINGGTHGNWARKFGAPRDGRWHVGMDLAGNHGDPVVAMEDGTVVGTQTFNLGTHAVLVEHDSGLVVLYGEVEDDSWEEFGIEPGSRVSKGDPIARIGCQGWKNGKCSSHMLHLETYVPGTTKNKQWYVGNAAPAAVLDPTRYLLRASERA